MFGAPMKVNENIIEYRNKRNLTQLDVATKSEINIKHYQAIERGEIQPRLKALLKIANAIDIPFDLLCKDAGKEFLVFSILSCLDKHSNQDLKDVYDILGAYIDE